MAESSQQEIQRPLINEVVKEQTLPQVVKQIKPASFFSLFTYTTASERFLMFIGSIGAIVAGGVFPFFLLFFADITTIFNDNNRQEAASQGLDLMWKFFIIGAITWFSNFIGLYCWNIVGSAQSARIKNLYYKTLLEQEVAWFDQNDPHKIVTQVATGITAIESATGEKVSMLVQTTITSVASFFLAFFKCWELSVMLLATLPALMLSGILFMKALLLYSQREKVSYQSAASRTQQALEQIKTVKGLVGEDYEMQKFEAALNEGQDKTLKYNLYKALGNGAIIMTFLGIQAFGFWYGKKLIVDNIDTGKYNAAVIIGTFFCFLIGGSSAGQVSPFMKSIAEGRIAMAEFKNLLKRKKTLVEPTNGAIIQNISNIKLGRVGFHYKEDQPVLKKVDINFEEGKVSALVGESGCGKSTIVQLLLRYYDCKEGQITVNSMNIKQIDIDNYRQRIGFVGQEPVLFAMSISENLKLANPLLTEEEMILTLKKANAWEFVSKMENGIDTYVGSGGAQLSGGQKQRIAIARALCKHPQILILDEATSALDRKNQREIQETLRNLQAHRITTVVIAHRLSTIKDADCIFVMSKGELNEKGTHDELINNGGLYAELVKTQLAAEMHMNEQEQHQSVLRKSTVKLQDQIQSTDPELNLTGKLAQPAKQKQDAVFRKLMAFQKSNCHLLFIGMVAALLAGLTWPLFNYLFSGIMDMMMSPLQNSDELDLYCLGIGGVAIAAGTMTAIYTFSFGLASQRLVFSIRLKLFNKMLRLPASYYDKKQNTAGAISTKLANDAFQINNMISGVLGVMCLNIATISASLVLGLYYSWKVTLIALALSPLIAVVGAINMKVIMKFNTKSEDAEKFLGSLMSDSVCNIRTVKALGRPKGFLDIFGKKLEELNSVNTEKHIKSAILAAMSRAMIMFVEGLIFYLAAVLFTENQVDSGRAVFTAVMSIIFAAMGVGQNSQFMPDMAKAKVAGAGIFDIIESKGEDELCAEIGENIIQDLNGTIEFRNVSFKYPEREKIVLQKLSFKVDKQKVALVGHSGSGKSTIVQLLMRFYDPTEGEIFLNGRNIKDLDLYSLRRQIGLVSQQPSLFIGSVKDNIQYNSKCSQKQISQAIEIAHVSKFIAQTEQGLEKEVGQKGAQVSGGQKQRIALSRCLVRNPAMFLFDEFTSALDADTEKIVFQNLKPVLSEKTSISVAHRLSTVEDCDHILVFKDGKIIEEGTYSHLMGLKNHFFSLAQGK